MCRLLCYAKCVFVVRIKRPPSPLYMCASAFATGLDSTEPRRAAPRALRLAPFSPDCWVAMASCVGQTHQQNNQGAFSRTLNNNNKPALREHYTTCDKTTMNEFLFKRIISCCVCSSPQRNGPWPLIESMRCMAKEAVAVHQWELKARIKVLVHIYKHKRTRNMHVNECYGTTLTAMEEVYYPIDPLSVKFKRSKLPADIKCIISMKFNHHSHSQQEERRLCPKYMYAIN